ncbi:MAG: hypothetical protein KAT00_04895 [Planctomycetes bacterium]|nr:hypothetical protein [Planctomycetota bacterium]
MNASQAQTATGVSRATIGRWIKAGKLAADTDGYFAEEDFDVLNALRRTRPGPGRKTVKPKPEAKPKPPPPKKKAAAKKSAAPKKPSKKKAVPKPTDAEMLTQARELCRKNNNHTIAYVQRYFKIGYNRAQRITARLKRELDDEASQPDEVEIRLARNSTSRQGADLRKALANAEKTEMEVKIKMKDLISRELVSRAFRKLYTIDSTEWRGLGPRLAPDIMALCEMEDPTKEVEISDRIEREVFRTLSHIKRVINEFLAEVESNDRIDAK